MAFAGMKLPRHPDRRRRGLRVGRAAYYMTLSKQWLAAVGRTEPNKSPTPFIISFIALLVMGFVLAGSIGHLGPGNVTVKNGIISGLIPVGGLRGNDRLRQQRLSRPRSTCFR